MTNFLQNFLSIHPDNFHLLHLSTNCVLCVLVHKMKLSTLRILSGQHSETTAPFLLFYSDAFVAAILPPILWNIHNSDFASVLVSKSLCLVNPVTSPNPAPMADLEQCKTSRNAQSQIQRRLSTRRGSSNNSSDTAATFYPNNTLTNIADKQTARSFSHAFPVLNVINRRSWKNR